MSEQVFYYLQVTSTLSVVLPLAAGGLRFRHLDVTMRCFMGFLAVGFAVDLSGWYFALSEKFSHNESLRHAYDLFEAVFLLWIIGRLAGHPLLKKLFTWLLFPLLIFWALRFYDRDLMSVFKSATQILFAFTASYVILRMVEKTEGVSRVMGFWVLLGIFFYCFTTYFIMGLLATALSNAWVIHNIINVATNLIYVAGFTRSRSSVARSPSAGF